VIGADDLETLGPYLPLAAKLGRLAMELTEGRADEIVLTTFGGLADYDTRLLTVAALNGAFQGRADRPVNYVNAPLIARERGIEVREERSRSTRDYTDLLRVEIRVGDERTRVAGTLIGRDNRQWLVSALGFDLDLELAPLLVLFHYDDMPGVIGRVGTLFGEEGVNIVSAAVGAESGGERAVMALTTDAPVRAEAIEKILALEGFSIGRSVDL
jgi:D-3-phosphoglycerate dehydrogenase